MSQYGYANPTAEQIEHAQTKKARRRAARSARRQECSGSPFFRGRGDVETKTFADHQHYRRTPEPPAERHKVARGLKNHGR